jgi:hypothetical protein
LVYSVEVTSARIQRWVTNPLGKSGSPLDGTRAKPLGDAEQWQTDDFLAQAILLMYAALSIRGGLPTQWNVERRGRTMAPLSESFRL